MIYITTYHPYSTKTHRFESTRHLKTKLAIKSNKLLKAHPNMKHRMTRIHASQEMQKSKEIRLCATGHCFLLTLFARVGF